MFAGSHFCIPILGVISVNAWQVLQRQSPSYTGREALVIGGFGLLPDLVDPHLSLADRMSSWSHTVWFLAVVVLFLTSLRWTRLQPRWPMIIACSVAVLLHIGCDAITGGVQPLWPIPCTIGRYFLGSNHWLQLDALLIVVTLISWLVVRHLGRHRLPPPCP